MQGVLGQIFPVCFYISYVVDEIRVFHTRTGGVPNALV